MTMEALPRNCTTHFSFVETHTIASDGRAVKLWVNEPAADRNIRTLAIVMPGFANRMHQHSALARQLVANGVTVVRFDFLNHVGLSHGEVTDFTISDAMISLETALGYVYESFNVEEFVLVSTSLSARVGLRQFAIDKRLKRFVAISGVVNMQETLARVLGQDYMLVPEEDLPEFVTVEGRAIGARRFYHDAIGGDWTVERAAAELAVIDRPVQWFVGSADEWVDISEVQACVNHNLVGCVTVTELTNSGHDIGRNASLARSLTNAVTSFCTGVLTDVIEPSFSEILVCALEERRLQRERGSTK